MIAAPSSPGWHVELAGTLVSAAFHGVMGGYALLAVLIAGSCLGAVLAVLARDVARQVIGELTFDVDRRPG
jgi:hypothetical protein